MRQSGGLTCWLGLSGGCLPVGQWGLVLSGHVRKAFLRGRGPVAVRRAGQGARPLPALGMETCAHVRKNCSEREVTRFFPSALEETEPQLPEAESGLQPPLWAAELGEGRTRGSLGAWDEGACLCSQMAPPTHSWVFITELTALPASPAACRSGLKLEPCFWKLFQPTWLWPVVVAACSAPGLSPRASGPCCVTMCVSHTLFY